MRALILTQRLPYAPNRGDRLRAFHQIRQLLGRGWTVDVLALVHDEAEAQQPMTLTSDRLRVSTARVRSLPNRIVGLASLPGSRPLTFTLLHSAESGPAIDTLVRDTPPDVVLACSSSMAAVALSSAAASIPLVIDFVDVDSEKWRALGARARWPMSWVYRREHRTLSAFEGDAARRAALSLVTTDRERDALQALAPRARIDVLSNGIDLDYFARPDDAARAERVVFTGVMNYAPNADAAIWLARDIWPSVRAQRPHAHLDIVGASPTAAVRALADEATGVHVTGSVPDVRPYLWQATVAAAPLRVARGVQNKVLEAAAAGVPSVVTSAVQRGLPPALASTCVVADDAEGFARALTGALACPADPGPWRAAVDDLDWSRAMAPLDAWLTEAATASR